MEGNNVFTSPSLCLWELARWNYCVLCGCMSCTKLFTGAPVRNENEHPGVVLPLSPGVGFSQNARKIRQLQTQGPLPLFLHCGFMSTLVLQCYALFLLLYTFMKGVLTQQDPILKQTWRGGVHLWDKPCYTTKQTARVAGGPVLAPTHPKPFLHCWWRHLSFLQGWFPAAAIFPRDELLMWVTVHGCSKKTLSARQSSRSIALLSSNDSDKIWYSVICIKHQIHSGSSQSQAEIVTAASPLDFVFIDGTCTLEEVFTPGPEWVCLWYEPQFIRWCLHARCLLVTSDPLD